MEPTIVVAAIGAAGLVASTWLPTRAAHRARRDVADRVGEKNGSGTVIEMMERALEQQGRIHAQLDAIHADQARHESLDNYRFRVLAERMGVLEHELNPPTD